MAMEEKCGCWAILRRSVSGNCKPSDSRNSANSIPKSSLVYDAGTYIAMIFSVFSSMNF